MSSTASRKLGRVLLGVFRFEIGLAVASAVFFLLYPLVTGELRFTLVDGLILCCQVAWSLSTLVIIVLWPVWIFKLHRDLSFRFEGYPIKPWHTIPWFLVPWYSVWGMLKLSKVLTDHLLAEEDEKFERQSYHAIDPRYQAWVVLYILFSGKDIKRRDRMSLGFRLLRIFTLLYFIWFCTSCLAFLGFGHVLNSIAPAMILLFHNVLLDLPVHGWMPGFPSPADTLLKMVFLILFLWLLVRLVKICQAVVTN